MHGVVQGYLDVDSSHFLRRRFSLVVAKIARLDEIKDLSYGNHGDHKGLVLRFIRVEISLVLVKVGPFILQELIQRMAHGIIILGVEENFRDRVHIWHRF